jgi:hypothetical protein
MIYTVYEEKGIDTKFIVFCIPEYENFDKKVEMIPTTFGLTWNFSEGERERLERENRRFTPIREIMVFSESNPSVKMQKLCVRSIFKNSRIGNLSSHRVQAKFFNLKAMKEIAKVPHPQD